MYTFGLPQFYTLFSVDRPGTAFVFIVTENSEDPGIGKYYAYLIEEPDGVRGYGDTELDALANLVESLKGETNG